MKASVTPKVGAVPLRGCTRKVSVTATTSRVDIRINQACSQDYEAISQVHQLTFYPTASFFAIPFLRLDRTMCLIQGEDIDRTRRLGRFRCLVARSPSDQIDLDRELPVFDKLAGTIRTLANAAPQRPLSPSPGPLSGGASPSSRGAAPDSVIIGACCVDSLGAHLPPRRLSSGRTLPRSTIAYLSNLCVHPSARRQRIAERLVKESEDEAATWGCRTIALHVEPTNEAAVRLYEKMGYRRIGRPMPEFLFDKQRLLQLYMRRLPKSGGGDGGQGAPRPPPAQAKLRMDVAAV